MNKTFKAEFLSPGDKFLVPTCVETLRNLKCIRASQDSVFISGEELKGEHWKPDNFYIAPSTPVEIDDRTKEEKKVIDKPEKITDNKDQIKYKKNMDTNTETKKSGRGRKPSAPKNYVIPSGEFTKVDLIANNSGMSASDASNFIVKALKANVFSEVGEVPKEAGKRGRKSKIYRLI